MLMRLPPPVTLTHLVHTGFIQGLPNFCGKKKLKKQLLDLNSQKTPKVEVEFFTL